jgi:hypothetical protein
VGEERGIAVAERRDGRTSFSDLKYLRRTLD